MTPAALTHAVSVAAGIASQLGIPLIASGVEMAPGEEVEFIKELAGHAPLVRKAPGMLDDETIVGSLRASARTILAIGGVSSEIAVLHSVLGARRQGFDVHVLVDCCGGLSARTEAAAFGQMQSAGAILSSVSSFFTGFVPRIDDEVGAPVFTSVARLWGWDG